MVEVAEKLSDPAVRYQLANSAARTTENNVLVMNMRTVGNFYESMGILMKAGFVDRELVMQLWAGNANSAWERLADAAAVMRRTRGKGLWENFEYLAVLSQDWLAAHPDGAYPSGVRRFSLTDKWIEDDARYAASLATA